MASLERRQAILSILNVRDTIRVAELSERLEVSDVTIRKDLAFLEEQGYLERTHGGAVLAERVEPHWTLSARSKTRTEAKHAIAAEARTMISHGETIYLDSGSTCAALAHEVAGMELRVVTNSLQVLNRLADQPGIALFVVGGSYRHDAGSFIGPWADSAIRSVQLDHAFLGATGVSNAGRFSSQNNIESQFKRSVIATARSSIALVDRSKIGVQAFSVFAEAEEIGVLVTDAAADQCRRLEEAGLHVIRVAPDEED